MNTLPPNTSQNALRNAFSLIELLVTISIIAVLAGMLLVSINMVRASARTAVCQNNIRQLGLASLVYATDNDDQWPVSEWADNPRFWGMRLGAYLADFSGLAFVPGKRPPVPFACPESKLVLVDAETGGDFSKNMFAGGYSEWHPDFKPFGSLSLYKPSLTMGYADNSGGHTSIDQGPREFASWVTESPETWGLGFWRHRTKASVVFLDGHTESRSPNQIQITNYRLDPWGWPGP